MDYIAIISDIKESKKIEDRNQIQENLSHILKCVNRIYRADISAKFVITLGDEFQGLLRNGSHLFDIVKYIQREMYPVRLRFGVGIGEINTNIFYEAAIGADGPAYYVAREMIECLREQEKKLKRQAPDIQISIYGTEKFEISEINTLLALMKILEDGWSEKQRFTVWDMEKNGGSQKECAKRMGTTQSTIARRLAGSNYLTYVQARKTVDEALRRLETGKNDN